MPSPSELLERPAQEAVRILARKLFKNVLEAAAELLDDDHSSEALHDLRTRTRRLLVVLEGYEKDLEDTLKKKIRKRLKKILDSTSEGRDAEAHLDWLEKHVREVDTRRRPGLEWMKERLSKERDSCYGKRAIRAAQELAALERPLGEALAEFRIVVNVGEGHSHRSFGAATADALDEQVNEARARLSAVASVTDEREAHRARIATKRLRYLLEPVATAVGGSKGVLDELRRLQDALGELHDVHVLAGRIGEEIEAAGAERARLAHAAAKTSDSVADAAPARTKDERPGLLALTRTVQEGVDVAFRKVERRWLGEAAKVAFDGVERIAKKLREKSRSDEEIERKYLLDRAPEHLKARAFSEIEQGYFAGRRISDRVRSTRARGKTRYFRTVKLGTGLRRAEFEEEIDRRTFDALWPLTQGRRIRKRRYAIRSDGFTWEIDVYRDRKLAVAEVELHSENDRPSPPPWLIPHVVRDVTEEREYRNSVLAK